MSEPIKTGDRATIIAGALGDKGPNVGKRVTVGTLRGEHSQHGREVECENMARKFAGAFLDGAFYQSNIAPTPAAQAAESVLEDAARLTTEQEYAIRQGHEIAASEAYFGARSKLDTNRNHNIFTAGFERGWDAARKQGGANG